MRLLFAVGYPVFTYCSPDCLGKTEIELVALRMLDISLASSSPRQAQDTQSGQPLSSGTASNDSSFYHADFVALSLSFSWGGRSKGFEYLGVFSDAGLAMCDPELIRFPGSKLAALCKLRIAVRYMATVPLVHCT